jgi:hypothetical protein
MGFKDVFYNYKPFNLNLNSTDTNATDAIAEVILPKLDVPQTDRNKKYLVVLILNVYQNYCMKKTMYTGFHKTRNYYQKKSRYNKNGVSNAIIKIMECMIEQQYILEKRFYHSVNKYEKSYTTRIRILQKLLDVINKHKLHINTVDVLPDTECIIIKETKGKRNVPVEYHDDLDIIKQRQILTAYNNLLKYTHIDCVDVGEDGVRIGKSKYPILINQQNKFVRRIFNLDEDNYALGGRYYGGWWQGMNKEWRKKIKINGLDCTEIDYSGMGIKILYSLEKIEIDERDPYDLTGYYKHSFLTKEDLRPLLKHILIIMLNCKSKPQAVGRITADVNDEDKGFPTDINVPQLMEAFAERHKPIKHLFYKSKGKLQMRLDSDVCELIIDSFTFKGIPVLTVHDSFVTDIAHAGELEEKMIDFYNRVLGQSKIDIKVTHEDPRYSEHLIRLDRYMKLQPSNPVEEQKQFEDAWWRSEDTINDKEGVIHLDEGVMLGDRRTFKDKDYQKRLKDWVKLKLWDKDDYYSGGYSFGASEGNPSKEELEAELKGDWKLAQKIHMENLEDKIKRIKKDEEKLKAKNKNEKNNKK